MFKSNLRFSSWVVLASFFSVPLSHAMDNEEEKHKNLLLPKNMIEYIAGFVRDPQTQGSMALVNKTWNRAMKSQAEKVHKSIQEKMKSFDEGDQNLIRDVFGKELDCNKHTHFNVLKFMDCFSENTDLNQNTESYKKLYQGLFMFMDCFSENTDLNQNTERYKTLYQEILKFPNLSKFHKRTMMVNAIEFGLLEWPRPELIQKYEAFSLEQMGILGQYAEVLIPKLSYKLSSDHYYKEYLTALQPFSVKKLNILGKYGQVLIPKMSDDHYYKGYLTALQPFSVKQMEILGKYGEFLIPKMSDAMYYKGYLTALLPFSVKKLNILGKYGQVLIPKMSNDYYYEGYLEALQPLSVEQMKALGRCNTLIVFQDVEDWGRTEFIKNNLTNLTPKEIELFAQEKEKEINENK